MLAAAIAVEVLVIAAVKASEAFHFIFDCVRVDNVHNHGNAEFMGSVYQALQLFRSTETA